MHMMTMTGIGVSGVWRTVLRARWLLFHMIRRDATTCKTSNNRFLRLTKDEQRKAGNMISVHIKETSCYALTTLTRSLLSAKDKCISESTVMTVCFWLLSQQTDICICHVALIQRWGDMTSERIKRSSCTGSSELHSGYLCVRFLSTSFPP